MKLSVVIPAYNVEDLIGRCVRSVFAAAPADVEVIVVDDGSRDGTLEAASALAREDNRVKVIHTDNRGAFRARLTGVENASGEWVTFADADDTVNEGSLTRLFELSDDTVDIVIGVLNINNKRKFIHGIEGTVTAGEYINAILEYRTSIGLVAKLIRRRLFADGMILPERRISVNEDMLMLLNLAAKARGVRVTNDVVVYNYLFRPVSMRSYRMAVEDWHLLFTLIDKVLAQAEVAPGWERGVLKYKLRTVYTVLVPAGHILSPQHPVLAGVLAGADILTSAEDKKMLRVLSSERRQRAYYLTNRTIWVIKQAVKRLIGRK